MRLSLAIVGLSLAGTLNAAALDVRPASEAEVRELLFGCWYRPAAPADVQFSLCFSRDGDVHSGAYLPGALEGFDSAGTYNLSNDELVVQVSNTDRLEGWALPFLQASCDVVVGPKKILMLKGCVGTYLEGMEDFSDQDLIFLKEDDGAAWVQQVLGEIDG